MLVTSAQFQTTNTLFTIPTPGHVTPAAAASSDCRGIFLRKILSVSHHSQNVKSQPRPGISGLTCSHFCAQRSESHRGSSRAVNKWGLMLLKSNHMIYSSICSGHLLELEITRRPIGVSLVTRHSVTLLLVVLLCGKQLNHRATEGDPLFFSVSFFFFLGRSVMWALLPPYLAFAQLSEWGRLSLLSCTIYSAVCTIKLSSDCGP